MARPVPRWPSKPNFAGKKIGVIRKNESLVTSDERLNRSFMKKVCFIVGPTAVGKTEASVIIAKKLNTEIVSCDSMLVYKEINIANAKPTREQLQSVPHHLIDVVSVRDEFDVSQFNKAANEAIVDIHRKGKVPLIVGGSGMYMSILLDGIFSDEASDEGIRLQLEKECNEKGLESLLSELTQVDPQTAAKVKDRRRIVRALEVFRATGKPISYWQQKREGLWDKFDVSVIVLSRNREELYDRINRRVDQMFELGVVDEFCKLKDVAFSHTAKGLLGYKEIFGLLNSEHDQERANYLMKLNTRHFAKRQLTWFRRDERLKWIDLIENDSSVQIANKILEAVNV